MAIFSCLTCVSAQNETEIISATNEEEIESRIEEEVKSTENGHFNITFDDGYSGYCINYGDHEATIGDTFNVKDTSHAINNNNGKEVGNYIKIYFVDYYEHAMKDEIVTQHTIWHFTDDFNGWRLNYDIIDNVKNTALTKTIPDSGAVKQINNTTEAVFYFEVLSSGISGHQNFFGYKIIYRDIGRSSETNDTENSTLDNSTSVNSSGEGESIQYSKSNNTNESTDFKSNNANSTQNYIKSKLNPIEENKILKDNVDNPKKA